jgi:hypothetical protein
MAGSLLEMITGGESGKGRGFAPLPRPFPTIMNETEISEKVALRCSKYFFDHSNVDDFVKSRNQTAKKKDPDARRANPEE